MVAPEGAIDDTLGSDTVQRRLKELPKPDYYRALGILNLDDPLLLQ